MCILFDFLYVFVFSCCVECYQFSFGGLIRQVRAFFVRLFMYLYFLAARALSIFCLLNIFAYHCAQVSYLEELEKLEEF